MSGEGVKNLPFEFGYRVLLTSTEVAHFQLFLYATLSRLFLFAYYHLLNLFRFFPSDFIELILALLMLLRAIYRTCIVLSDPFYRYCFVVSSFFTQMVVYMKILRLFIEVIPASFS